MRSTPLLCAALAALTLSACGEPANRGPRQASIQDDLARARAAAFFIPGITRDLSSARQALAPLIARPAPATLDLVHAAIIELHDANADLDTGRALIRRAAQAEPDELHVRWVSGLYANNFSYEDGELEAARDDFQFVVDADPDDAAARIQLAETLDALGDIEGGLAHCRAVRAMGLGPNTPYYLTATHKLYTGLFRLARNDEQRAEARALAEEKKRLEAENENAKAADNTLLLIGRYGDVEPPRPRAVEPGAPSPARFPAFRVGPGLPVAGAGTLLARDVDADGSLDLLVGNKQGLSLFRGATGPGERIWTGPVSALCAGDLDDGDPEAEDHAPALEVLLLSEGRAWLLEPDSQDRAWDSRELEPAGLNDALMADLDHDGGLDLVLAGQEGITWLRNDGRTQDAPRLFDDATPASFAVGPVNALLSEDFDHNQAVDLLALTPDGLVALAGLWGGVFEDRTREWNLADARLPTGTRPLCADLDGDLRPDLLLPGPNGLSLRLHQGQAFGRALPLDLDRPAPADLALEDLDGDGRLDLLGRQPSGSVLAWRGPLPGRTAALGAATLTEVAGAGPFTLADMDRDQALDLVCAGADQVAIAHGAPPPGGSLTLVLEGHKDNTGGVGAVLQLLSGGITRRIYWRGGPRVVGLAGRPDLDVLFIRWPNGVHQREFELPVGQTQHLPQNEGLTGSCPFLYTWNGERYEFISDVLGASPLGLPMVPGRMVPFDHDEYVRVTGSQFVPRDGELALVFTEELREVTYLDQVVLHAIDHPAEVEIQPNEAFVFPPFPEPHIHTLREVRSLPRVLASNGQDVTTELAAIDGLHATPFTPRPPRFRGLTEPWFLDLTLASSATQRAELAAAPRIRLALTGWLLWGDASVNLSAARHPEVAFEPPMLWVPEGDGWRPAGPPIGFITGKTKTMLVDVTNMVDRDDPRLRLSTTLELHWDAIRLVLDDDDAELVDTALPASGAELAFRGFSAPAPDPVHQDAERFDFDRLAPARWDQHPGLYTRYGDVLPLIGQIDDRTVIMGAGDALQVRFDARALPPVPAGFARDWLVFLDGWAKDRDPNTKAARTVEPLPFHAMGGYPPEQPFPSTPELDAWRAQWNTRPGRTLIEPIRAATDARHADP